MALGANKKSQRTLVQPKHPPSKRQKPLRRHRAPTYCNTRETAFLAHTVPYDHTSRTAAMTCSFVLHSNLARSHRVPPGCGGHGWILNKHDVYCVMALSVLRFNMHTQIGDTDDTDTDKM